MHKTVIVLSSIALSLAAVCFIALGVKYTENETEIKSLEEQLKKQEQKNEVLQEENGSLHDTVWTMSQQLMKEDVE